MNQIYLKKKSRAEWLNKKYHIKELAMSILLQEKFINADSKILEMNER